MPYTNQVWGRPGRVTKILQAENGQKVDEFEPIYLGNYRYWWKMFCGVVGTSRKLVVFVGEYLHMRIDLLHN